MRPTFLGFETAKRGITISQKGLDIVGNNLTNIETPGYTRQRLDVASVAPSASSARVSGSRIDLAGQGVEALGVSQTRDAFLDRRFRDEYSEASYHTQVSKILQDIQSALGDPRDVTSESGLVGAVQRMYESLTDFSGNATSETHANLVMSAFGNFAQTIRQFSDKLEDIARQQKYDLGVSVGLVNETLQKIAHLNEVISKDSTVVENPDNESFRPNELYDQRNLLLDSLSGYGNIRAITHKDGTITVEMGGHKVVDGKKFDSIAMQENQDFSTVSLRWKSTGNKAVFSGGSLQGYTDFINGRGCNVQGGDETACKGILYYRDRLDTMASTFANLVNHVIPQRANPLDPKDNTLQKDKNGNIVYKELISARQKDNTTDINKPITAANIALSDNWTKNGAGYFIFNKGENDPRYAQQICNLLTGKSSEFCSSGETFTGNFEEYITDYSGKLGTDANFYQGRSKASSAVADDFLDRRDEISGVSRDEETTQMLTYQKSFSAAARLMTTLDEALDVLINRTGRVGL